MILNLLLTGNELMTGDIVDSNSAMIARYLAPHGWSIKKKLTVGDDLHQLIDALRWLASDCDALLVNGGLGPTVDDLTAQALAAACDVALVEQPDALEHLTQWCARLGIVLNAANRKQTILPEGCKLVANPIGSAVGFSMQLGRCLVVCTPGVPRELDAMLTQEIIPAWHTQFGAGEMLVQRFALFGIGESSLQQQISEAIPDWPTDVDLGFRAGFSQLDLKLTTTNPVARAKCTELIQRLQPVIKDFVIGEGETSLAAHLVQLLQENNKQITLAESCTGGSIAAALTQIPGASKVFSAGFITYSNAIKHSVLDVDNAVLNSAGAVSEPVVLQMAKGALQRSGADYAVAVSGIAGPDGGTEEKPVGTVWIAWGSIDNLRAQQMHIRFPRELFQQYVSCIGMDLIRRELRGITATPPYFRYRK
ncbi:MAG: damage-inducible protein CinA [Verrucomicrobiaceae bacterium]|nr:damage-inducible protein CinA [Verrucomicrobiaceae bacterium]